MALGQSLQQKLLQKLSPQQIQLMKLLQVPTANLEERIKEELEENPALEMGEDEDTKEADDEIKDDALTYGDFSKSFRSVLMCGCFSSSVTSVRIVFTRGCEPAGSPREQV